MGENKCSHTQSVELTEFGTCYAVSNFYDGKLDEETPTDGLVGEMNGRFHIHCNSCGFSRRYNWYKPEKIPEWVQAYYRKNAKLD